MPQATPTHTPNPIVVLQVAASSLPQPPAARSILTYQDAILREACHAAMVSFEAMTALSLSVAELPPDDLRHEVANAAIGRLRPVWRDQVEQAWSVPASGPSGLRDKAALLDSLIDLHDDNFVQGNAALCLAASLAADVLQQHAAATI
jgi:hypothetical protein